MAHTHSTMTDFMCDSSHINNMPVLCARPQISIKYFYGLRVVMYRLVEGVLSYVSLQISINAVRSSYINECHAHIIIINDHLTVTIHASTKLFWNGISTVHVKYPNRRSETYTVSKT